MDHPTKFKNQFGNNSEQDRLLNIVQEWDAGTSSIPGHAATHKSEGADALKIDEMAEGTDVTTLDTNTLVHGLCPKLPGVETEFLNGSGLFSVPSVQSVVGVAYGSASVLATTTSIEVTHGLVGAPASVLLTPSSNPKGKFFWVDTVGTLTFKINIDSADATDPISFSWCAKV
jgi:hypothetical protein